MYLSNMQKCSLYGASIYLLIMTYICKFLKTFEMVKKLLLCSSLSTTLPWEETLIGETTVNFLKAYLCVLHETGQKTIIGNRYAIYYRSQM